MNIILSIFISIIGAGIISYNVLMSIKGISDKKTYTIKLRNTNQKVYNNPTYKKNERYISIDFLLSSKVLMLNLIITALSILNIISYDPKYYENILLILTIAIVSIAYTMTRNNDYIDGPSLYEKTISDQNGFINEYNIVVMLASITIFIELILSQIYTYIYTPIINVTVNMLTGLSILLILRITHLVINYGDRYNIKVYKMKKRREKVFMKYFKDNINTYKPQEKINNKTRSEKHYK